MKILSSHVETAQSYDHNWHARIFINHTPIIAVGNTEIEAVKNLVVILQEKIESLS